MTSMSTVLQSDTPTVMTYIIHSNLSLSRGLHEGAVTELSGEVEALVLANHPLVLQVALVTNLVEYQRLKSALIT